MINDRNEIKISFDEPKYHIDRANKVVVCILKGKVNSKFNYCR